MLNKLTCFILISAGLLTGCSSLRTGSSPTNTAITYPAATYYPGELNGETLFDLLAAELAGHQRQYDVSLKNYLKQAELTGDRGIIQRATRIAQFSKDQAGLEQAAKIWIQHYPEDLEPYELLSGLFIHQGKYTQALPYIERALVSDSRQILLLISSAAEKLTIPEAQDLNDALDSQIQLTPKRSELWITKGVIERRLSHPDKALYSFDQSLRYAPDAVPAMLQKADLLKELKRYQEALTILSKLAAQQPDNKQIAVLETQVLYKAGKHSAAVRNSQALIQDFPDDQQLHLYLALLALDYNRLEDSRAILEPLADRDDDTSAHFYLGLIAEQQENQALAIDHYLQVEHGTNILQAYTRVAGLLKGEEHRQRIDQILTTAINKHAELGPSLINLYADWLRSTDLKDEAIGQLDNGLTLYPDDITLLYARAMSRPEDELPQAEKEFRFILKQQPDNAMALNALGYTLTIYTDRIMEAHELLTRALQLKPDETAIIDSMGWNLYKQNRIDEALVYLEQAYSAYPDPEVGSHLVAVLVKLDQVERARKIFQELSEKYPGNPFLKDMIQSLKDAK